MVNPNRIDLQAEPQEGEFRRIKGIAQATEQALHVAGILTFNKLASLTPDEIAEALPGQVGVKERAVRQDWKGEAAKFAHRLSETSKTEDVEEDTQDPSDGKHYESFKVSLLLHDNRNVKRTDVEWVRTSTKDHWSGWEPDRLTAWIAEKAELALDEIASPKLPTHAVSPNNNSGVLKITNFQVIGPASKKPKKVLLDGAPFELRLDLDFSETDIPANSVLCFRCDIKIRKLHNWEQMHMGAVFGNINTDDPTIMTGLLSGLPTGIYHLQAAIVVGPIKATDTNRKELDAISEGLLVRVLESQPELT